MTPARHPYAAVGVELLRRDVMRLLFNDGLERHIQYVPSQRVVLDHRLQ
jgi:hypothetical protein